MYSLLPTLHPQPLQPDAAPRPVWQLDQTLRAGFPSPALDEGARRIDLNEVLVRHPEATFVMRVAGDSMREAGIDEGDTVVVDRAIRPAHGMVVVAVFDGEFTEPVLPVPLSSLLSRVSVPPRVQLVLVWL